MKTIIYSLIFVLPLMGFAQTQTSKLSDSYGKAAFLALKAIERDSSAPPQESKATNDLLDLADAEAAAKNEQAMTVTLRRIYFEHRINNLDRDNVNLEYKAGAILGHFNKDQYINDPHLQAITNRETECFTPLAGC